MTQTTEKTEKCGECKGAGSLKADDVPWPWSVWATAPCPSCNGTGTRTVRETVRKVVRTREVPIVAPPIAPPGAPPVPPKDPPPEVPPKDPPK